MNPLFRIVSVPALTLLFPHNGYTANPPLETILSELRRVDAAREQAIRDMVYTAETTVVEWEDASRKTIKSETRSVRRVYVREPNQIYNEYLSMTIDGRMLSKREMERELAKQRRGGRNRGDGEFQSPFSSKVAALYEFELKGEDVFDSRAVWLVGFKPKEPEENLFAGIASISQSDYQPLYVEMAPAELPGILEEFAMSICFGRRVLATVCVQHGYAGADQLPGDTGGSYPQHRGPLLRPPAESRTTDQSRIDDTPAVTILATAAAANIPVKANNREPRSARGT